jgi:hypothetical protein
MATNASNNQHSASLNDIYELVSFIKDNVPVREEVATKQDLTALRGDFAALSGDFTALRGDFAALRGDFAALSGDFTALRAATKQDLTDLESRMVTVDIMAEMESRLATKFVTKEYLDNKLADQTAEIFERLERRHNKDRNFKEKLVVTLSGHSVINKGEAGDLKELI